MEDLWKLEHFLTKYIQTMKVEWLELLIFEYYNHPTALKKATVQDNKFKEVKVIIRMHILQLISHAVDIEDPNADNTLNLRNFFTRGIGARVMVFLNDLDLQNKVIDGNVATVLVHLFPTELWEHDMSISRLSAVSRTNIVNIYKAVNVDPLKNLPKTRKTGEDVKLEDTEEIDIETFRTYEFRHFVEHFYLSPPEYAAKFIELFHRLTIGEFDIFYETNMYIDTKTVTYYSINLALDNLESLSRRLIFNESDQTVIKKKLMHLLFVSYTNIIPFIDKPMYEIYEKILRIYETERDIEITCGLLIFLLSVFKQTISKEEKKDFDKFVLSAQQNVLEQIREISSDNQLLHCIHRQLIINIKFIKKSLNEQQNCTIHHRNNPDKVSHCIFERILIDSVIYIKSFKQLLIVLKHLMNGICCCNANLDTIEIFLRSSTIPSIFLEFIHKRINRAIFNGGNKKTCMECSEKLKSDSFRHGYLNLYKKEFLRREGYELYNLYYHLINTQKFMAKEFLRDIIIDIIIPTFKEAKRKFFSNQYNNHESKDICCFCLQLMSDNAALTVFDGLTEDLIIDLGDCTLVPAMSIYSCMILRYGLECFVTEINEKKNLSQKKRSAVIFSQKIKSILFTNTLSLISELIDIYNGIGLAKISFQIEPQPSTSDASEFEIVDKNSLKIRENLSKLDVLFLNSVYCNILCDLIAKLRSFKADFLANICNNFNEDILFSIAYHAINTILLRKDINPTPTTGKNDCQNDERSNHLERCDYLTSVITSYEYDINYDFIISRSYEMFEICQNLIDKLQSESREENPFCMTYNTARDKNVLFVPPIYRNNFLSENALDYAQKDQCALDIKDRKDNDAHSYQHWFQQIFDSVGNSERINVRDAITKLVYRFIRPENDLQEIYRLSAIKDITNNIGTKYLSSIAKSCFEICFRIWRNQKLGTRMSAAIQELKLLLLQDEWINNKDSLFDALELLIKVAEMENKNVNQVLMTNTEPMPQIDTNFFDKLSISSMKIQNSDSEDEDNETEVYFSADENYDADEEYFSTAADLTLSFNTVSNFKSSNEHICRLVIDILMSLSLKYIENRDQWDTEDLINLMKRLSCMNNYFGRSDFIIKGFWPVLTRNENEFEALQKGVLELIGDLNSPEILKACFSLLTNDNVPVELIISRLETLCKQEIFPKPFTAVQYPICQDKPEITITSACDADITALINSYREYHIANDFWTPFVESSQIIPLNIFERKIWHSSGYTLSTWIELEQYERNDATSIHLLSLGTDKLVFSMYINSDGFFEFNVIKPNQNYGNNKKANRNKFLHDNTSSKPDQSNKENNKNKRNIKGIASVLDDNREQNIRTRGSIKNGFKKSMSREDSFSRRMETTKVSRKSTKCKVPYDKWTHICVSIRNSDSNITILITLDGIDHENIEIPVSDMLNLEVNGKLQLLFIGSQNVYNDDDFQRCLKYSMSNVLLFQTLLDTNLIACLFGLGPDCENFMICNLMQILPLRGYIDISKLINRTSLSGTCTELMSRLQSKILLTHNFKKASYATIFMKADYGKRTGIYNLGKIAKASNIESLARSIYFSGGLSSMLFLFARTVELTDDSETQSSALYIFLKTAYSNNYLNAEFEQRGLFKLVAHVFKHGNCYRGPGMLKAILDVIYGGSIFLKRSKYDEYSINEKSLLNIQNGSLLIKLLNNFNIFQTSSKVETRTLYIFFKSITTAVRDSHPCKAANLQCLRDHYFYEKLIDFCKTHLASTPSSMKINTDTAFMIVELIKMLCNNPPTMWTVNEIQKLLILLHHPSDSFVTHDRSNFNFILSYQKPKHNRSIQMSIAKQFSFSTKIRSASSPQSPKTPQKTPKASQEPQPGPSQTPDSKYEPSTSYQSETDQSFVTAQNDLDFEESSPKVKRRFERARKFDELDKLQMTKIKKFMKTEVKTNDSLFDSPPAVNLNRKRLKKSTPKKVYVKKRISRRRKQQEKVECVLDLEAIEKFKQSFTLSNYFSSIKKAALDCSGIHILQELLLIMLADIIKSLDASRMQSELSKYLKIECFIMFANNRNADVRAAVINLIHILTRRQSTDLVNSYQKANYWIHLGNQLAIWPVSDDMVYACLGWIYGDSARINNIEETAQFEIIYRPAFRVLILMLPSMVNNNKLHEQTIKFLNIVMESSFENYQYLMENGLVTALIKSLFNVGEIKCFDITGKFLEKIAVKSFETMGVMHILWDLLYGLSYAERHNKCIRQVHLEILRILLNSCLVRQDRRGNRIGDTRYVYAITRELGNLSASEIKTRFNLVLDRSIQFIISWEKIGEIKVFEVFFIKFLLDMCFSGIQHGSLLLWALNPEAPTEVKLFTAHKLLANLVADQNYSIAEAKMFKSLLFQFINNNQKLFTEDQIKIFTKYCGSSITQQQPNWNWSMSATDKVATIRYNANVEQLQQTDKIIFKLEPLVHSCIDGAMRMTREVIDIQNIERRNLMNQLKKTQEIDFYHEWYELIQRMTHEDAPWYNEALYPTTFELDETEGPGRMRIRLKRTVFRIEERFFNEEFKFKAGYQNKKQLLDYLLNPKETERYSIRHQIIFTFNAKHLTMEQEIDGEIIITETQFIFLTNHNTHNNSIISNIDDICEVWNRRYQHKEVALEIFLKTNKSFFIIFDSDYDRDIVSTYMSEKINFKENIKRVENVTQMWTNNMLTNFEYLMELNKLSGRNYNDISQYPIFPWILRTFEGDVLDLTDDETFRKFNRTISTQFEGTEEQYIGYYNDLIAQMNDQQAYMKPYHYTSLYSNSGTVLHFLVRLPPFTNMFLLYQDNNFDIPDRTFHNLATTFRLTSRESATDVKELIPEFFSLPDFLENQEGFNYGKRQTGEEVNDVKLPEWCDGSARTFTLIHRQAFESEYVRKNLHQWIDLIFGFKQKGKAAVDAINVFHFATYPEILTSKILDPVERSACETMIKTYGQVPKQIFTSAHKKSTIIHDRFEIRQVLTSVKGLRWGNFTGSPQFPKPKLVKLKNPVYCKHKNMKLVLAKQYNTFLVVPYNCSLIQGRIPDTVEIILWKERDGIVRKKTFDKNKSSQSLFSIPSCDPVTCCLTDMLYPHIWFGHLSGKISVYVRFDTPADLTDEETNLKATPLEDILDIKVPSTSTSVMKKTSINAISNFMYPIILLRHEGEVLSMKMCVEFKIAVSIGIDGRTVIWDTQKIEYIRTIEPSCNTLRSQLTHVDISTTLGDILTVFNPKDEDLYEDLDAAFVQMSENNGDDFINVSMSVAGKSQLRLNNINGKYIKHSFHYGTVTATCFSFLKEGTGVNVIAVAFSDFSIRLYSTWNLQPITQIDSGCTSMIKGISFSTSHYIGVITDSNVTLWTSDGLPDCPNIHDIVLVNS